MENEGLVGEFVAKRQEDIENLNLDISNCN